MASSEVLKLALAVSVNIKKQKNGFVEKQKEKGKK
jgi:hypothetical protein